MYWKQFDEKKVKNEEGKEGRYAFVLTPNWIKVRWRGGVLQPSKLYCLGNAGPVEAKPEKVSD